MRKNTVILERRFVSAGSILISEGDEAHNAYLIQSGSVSVFTKTGEGKEVELARLGVGEICGEMALFNEKRRSASVRVTEDANLIIISKAALKEKLENSDPTIKAVVNMLIKRLGAGNMLVTGNNRTPTVEDMIELAGIIYENIAVTLDEDESENFKAEVLPLFDRFVARAESYRKEKQG
ncbi:MAG: cyclic nucleotide-binding domain-containing protein [Alphaproteobacteria bacterium]|nr:cyclic nucleotide-binding domain-containing protein [Alphaproteobacteria bacterium]MCB9975444.1 cyclic nucleotide-binding domain-containing protein [Rhodospirillales bacterium]